MKAVVLVFVKGDGYNEEGKVVFFVVGCAFWFSWGEVFA